MSKEITLSQSNLLTQARYDFTKIEKRAVYFIIQEVRRQFVDNADGQKDLFGDLVVQMDTTKLKGSDTVLRDVYNSLKSLRRKSIWIEDDERVLEVGYINYFEHMKRSSQLEVQVSNKILPYLVKLAKEFTTYSLTVAISLKTKYSQRFYEYCSQFKSTGFMYVKIDELRSQMMIEEKYSRYATLRARVIDTAHKELKELYDKGECDLYFEYSEDRFGRTVVGLKITIITRDAENKRVENQNPNDLAHQIRLWLESWLNARRRPKNKEWVNGVINHLKLHTDLLPKAYKRLEKMQRVQSPDSYGAYARHIIEEDFLSQATTIHQAAEDIKPEKEPKKDDHPHKQLSLLEEAEKLTKEEEAQALADIEKLKGDMA